jgi:hypothetical protein
MASRVLWGNFTAWCRLEDEALLSGDEDGGSAAHEGGSSGTLAWRQQLGHRRHGDGLGVVSLRMGKNERVHGAVQPGRSAAAIWRAEHTMWQ